jgi:hypothetical protein
MLSHVLYDAIFQHTLPFSLCGAALVVPSLCHAYFTGGCVAEKINGRDTTKISFARQTREKLAVAARINCAPAAPSWRGAPPPARPPASQLRTAPNSQMTHSSAGVAEWLPAGAFSER